MTKRRKNLNSDHFDLLPFIAILMCMLGCLLLVTISIAAISIGPTAGEGWIPTSDPNQTSKIPILIEWDGATAIVHRNGRKKEVKWGGSSQRIKLGDTWLNLGSENKEANSEFNKLLDELAVQRATHYALFAVRQSGFDSFFRFSEAFRERKIDVGYEPIHQKKAVRLLEEKNKP